MVKPRPKGTVDDIGMEMRVWLDELESKEGRNGNGSLDRVTFSDLSHLSAYLYRDLSRIIDFFGKEMVAQLELMKMGAIVNALSMFIATVALVVAAIAVAS